MEYPDSMVRELIHGADRSKWIAHSNHNVKCFTQEEIMRFTNNYSIILGRGAFGEVYEGVLDDKSVVAVKRFVNNVKENFAKELTVHREINHKNVVRLVGYCLDEKALMMVTEYIPKGSLSDVLHGDNIHVPLDTRLRIAIECAEALGYMHSQMYTQVIHGDIKPANILLDDGLRAKVSDFGISRLVNTENTLYTVNVVGSIGYMDPMFARTGRLTAKSDVYSFGVVLFELITRKKARKDGEIDLLEIFTKTLAKGFRRVRELFDSEIAIPSNMKTIEQIAQLAGECLRFELDKRPEMLEVAERLRRLRKSLHQIQERRALFSWLKKNILAPADTLPQVSSSISHNVGIAAPAETTASHENSSSSHNVGIAAPAETTASHESSSSSHCVGIAAPAETTLSHESSSSSHYLGIAAPAETTTSQGSSSSSIYVGIAAPAETTSKSSRSRQNVGIVAPNETTQSQETSSPHSVELIFIVGSAMTSLFDLSDLLRASAEVLGTGAAGTSYKATLESGVELVVKRLKEVDLQREEFELRVEVIGAIQNKQIAPLQCYYYSMAEKLLVYNIFPMGSLSVVLHGDRITGPAPLDWEQRAAIALAVARGVAYIHSDGPSSCHGNIKSSNVMLTGTHDACVSDHGLTTLGLFPGASVYSAPEIIDARRASQKADMYSFGVLLLELLTRKSPVKSTQHEEGVDLPQWVRSVIFRETRKDWEAAVFDVELTRRWKKDKKKECMVRLVRLALKCCSQDANSRPTMSDVVQRIEEIR